MMGGSSSKPSILLALDWDHTVVDANTDIVAQDMAGTIPDDVTQLYSSQGWTEYMQAVFNILHKNGITQADYDKRMCDLPLTDGMMDLLKFAESNEHVEVVVISDSNSIFIDSMLKHHNLKHAVKKVYTNPSSFDARGCLNIEYYHTQTWCELSTRNLCKGYILKDHMKHRAKHGVHFKKVVYVGDGKNDLCPGVQLSPTDVLCAREDYSLHKLLRSGNLQVKAEIMYWNNGKQILPYLQA